MARRIATIATVVLCCFVGCWLIWHRLACFPPPEHVRTVGNEVQWHIDRCREHIHSITREGDGVRIVHDGWLMPIPRQPLKVGDVFMRGPDEHSSIQYTILAIEPDGIRVEYESAFDHRSFDRNLVSVDTGSIILPWKDSTVNGQSPRGLQSVNQRP